MNEDIFKISRDITRAKDLFEMSQERLEEIITILPKDKAYKILEEYYEVLVQLLTSVMYADGYKTLSHISLIQYFKDNYRSLNEEQIKLIDNIRKFRHGTVYYGKKISKDFLINNLADIKKIVSILTEVAKNKIGYGLLE